MTTGCTEEGDEERRYVGIEVPGGEDDEDSGKSKLDAMSQLSVEANMKDFDFNLSSLFDLSFFRFPQLCLFTQSTTTNLSSLPINPLSDFLYVINIAEVKKKSKKKNLETKSKETPSKSASNTSFNFDDELGTEI
jgi:hypothetical protein